MTNESSSNKAMEPIVTPENTDTAIADQASRRTLVPQEASSRLLHLFRQRWQSGQPLLVEDFFKEHPEGLANEEVALDLIYAEFVLRQESGGKPDVESFLRRFPAQRGRLEPLLSLDQALIDQAPLERNQVTQTLIVPSLQARAKKRIGISEESIGRYQVINLLGQGGQAKVFRALHPHLRKDVVVKVSLTPFAGTSEDRDHLVQEGRLLAQLDHPYLAHVYDLDFHEGHVFLVMEYIPGRTFLQWHEQEKPDIKRLVDVLARTTRALAAAHARGVTHGDLTPRNILIDEQGEPHVIDFGLARFRHAWQEPPQDPEAISGTLTFLSPEQARGQTDRIGPRTDLFSLGAVLYFSLTGKTLYSARDWSASLEQARRCDFDRKALERPDIPRSLARICLRLLAEDPEDRYPNADALARELERFNRPPWYRQPRILAAGALIAVSLLAAGWLWWQDRNRVAPDDTKGPANGKVASLDRKPRITVKARVEDRFFNLPQPLESGQEVYIQARVPAGVHASLFLFTSEGKLKHLVDWPASAEETTRRYPQEEESVVPLVGRPGTEVLLLVGNREGPVSPQKVQTAWAEEKAWPMLPPERAWRMQAHGVTPLERSRDFGMARKVNDPEEQVEALMESLRGRLKDRFELLEALAFSHGG